MIIDKITVGLMGVNNYLVIDEDSRDAVLIDAGGDLKATKKLLAKHNANLKYILNTHGHFDHVAGDYDIKNEFGVEIFLNENDMFLIESFKDDLKLFNMPTYETPQIDHFIIDGEEIELGSLKFKVIHTPGHTPGGVCYLIGNYLFSGDTLFYETVGRTDLTLSSFKDLKLSIANKLFTLNDNIKVYPGHGKSSTIGHEKLHNPYFLVKA